MLKKNFFVLLGVLVGVCLLSRGVGSSNGCGNMIDSRNRDG